jgi:hypothetical protein
MADTQEIRSGPQGGAARLVREDGRPVAEVTRGPGDQRRGTRQPVNADKRRRGGSNGALSEDERAELAPAVHGAAGQNQEEGIGPQQ